MIDDFTDVLGSTRVLSFDCYGTLIDWKAGLGRSFAAIFGPAISARMDEVFNAYVQEEAREESAPFRKYREVLSATCRRLAARFGLEIAADRANLLAYLLPDWAPFPDTVAALQRLKRRFRLGILSNIDRDLFAGTSRHLGVEFDFVITAEDVQSYKPGLSHFRKYIELHGGKGGLLHVGQSLYHDGAAAQRVSIPFVWINRYQDPAIQDLQPLATFPDLKSFAGAVEAIPNV